MDVKQHFNQFRPAKTGKATTIRPTDAVVVGNSPVHRLLVQSNLCTLIATCCFNSCGEQSLSLKDNVHRTGVSDTRLCTRMTGQGVASKTPEEAGWSQVPVHAAALWLGAWYLLRDVTCQWPCLRFVTIPHHSSLTPSLPQAVTFPG